MTEPHDGKRKRVSEPLQVYLDVLQRRRLDSLAGELGLSKSDVVRRGLEALERQLTDPAEHPALRIIGIADAETITDTDYNVAREHDRFLAESELKSWKPPAKKRKRAG
ncbi:MAG: CopG family transcriptional regulator [Gemmatimonadales bacterium]